MSRRTTVRQSLKAKKPLPTFPPSVYYILIISIVISSAVFFITSYYIFKNLSVFFIFFEMIIFVVVLLITLAIYKLVRDIAQKRKSDYYFYEEEDIETPLPRSLPARVRRNPGIPVERRLAVPERRYQLPEERRLPPPPERRYPSNRINSPISPPTLSEVDFVAEEWIDADDVYFDEIGKIIDEKKRKFINIPAISFHFADHELIRVFYNEYFKEPTIESVVSETIGENDGEIKGNLPQILEAGISQKDTNRLVSNIKPVEISSNAMFLRYQRETIKRRQVLIGLEEVDVELNELQAFDTTIANLSRRYDIEIDENILSSKRTSLMEKAAEKTMVKLENATGWILIEGKFSIELLDNIYKCVYHHPVNEYLSTQIGPITISMFVSPNSLEEHIKANYAQSIGKLIPLKVYAQVWQPIDRQNHTWDLQIVPLAIY